jgi:hypothetical protein
MPIHDLNDSHRVTQSILAEDFAFSSELKRRIPDARVQRFRKQSTNHVGGIGHGAAKLASVADTLARIATNHCERVSRRVYTERLREAHRG